MKPHLPSPAAMQQATVYVGLIRDFVQLQKTRATAEVEGRRIERDYAARIQELAAKVDQAEMLIKGTFKERQMLLTVFHEQFKLMMEAGDTEAALIINQRMTVQFSGSFVDAMVDHNNRHLGSGYIQIDRE